VLRGHAASPGAYEGRARVIADPAQLGRLQPGDVLVASATSEGFNVALPLVGAIVTDWGGLLSHAAIVSREIGIPCVVGMREATSTIPDGTRVRVDGTAGEVAIL
jgi:pyruvate,water dikinase